MMSSHNSNNPFIKHDHAIQRKLSNSFLGCAGSDVGASQQSLVVYGPKGCGKTANAIALATAFGLSTIIDGWDGVSDIPTENALILTNSLEPVEYNVRTMDFENAMKEVRPIK